MQTQPSAPPEQVPPSPASGHSPFIPYHTTKHRVTKGRYITSNDPRGYIPVYEYPLNNQWVMMDVDDGYVLWTGIWKALGNAKADIVKMIESQPELESQLRRVRGGYLKIQGTWMPYEVALRLARRVAWPIREDLVPLFGPTFPSTCLSPDQPGYGQVLENSGRRRKRTNNQVAKLAANRDIHGSAFPAYIPRYHHPPSPDYPPTSYLHPYPPPSHHLGYGHPHPGRGYDHGIPAHPSYPSRLSHPPSHSGGPHAYPISPTMTMSSQDGRARRNSDSRRYTPYPHPSSSQHPYGFPPEMPAQGGGFNLPPISAINFNQPAQSGEEVAPRPMLERPLPPIGSLGDGYTPSMDTASVLRRLKIDDANAAASQQIRSPTASASPLAPLGHRSEMPPEKYLDNRRRSLSAPPPHFYPSKSGDGIQEELPHSHSRGHGYHPYARPTYHYPSSGDTPGYNSAHSPPLGPHRRDRERPYHGPQYEQHPRHHRDSVSTRPLSPSYWAQTAGVHSPAHSTDPSPPSPGSSAHGRWSPPGEPKIWEVDGEPQALKGPPHTAFVSTEALPPSVRLRGHSQEDELMSDSDGSPRGSPQLPMRQIDITVPAAEFERRPHLIPVSDVRRSPVAVPAVIPVGMGRINRRVKTPVSPVARRSSATSASSSPSVETVTNTVVGASSIESSPQVRAPIRPW